MYAILRKAVATNGRMPDGEFDEKLENWNPLPSSYIAAAAELRPVIE